MSELQNIPTQSQECPVAVFLNPFSDEQNRRVFILYVYGILWYLHHPKHHPNAGKYGVSQNEAAGTGSLSQGSVSRVCFVVCFGGLFRTVLLPRTFKFKGSVSESASKVCFGGLFRQSRTSQPYLKLHSTKKCKPI